MSGFDTENGLGEPAQAPSAPTAPARSEPPTYGSRYGYGARPSFTGNAELVVYVAALAVAAVVAWIADALNAASWFEFFKWTTVGYLLARGIAKASRVLEQ